MPFFTSTGPPLFILPIPSAAKNGTFLPFFSTILSFTLRHLFLAVAGLCALYSSGASDQPCDEGVKDNLLATSFSLPFSLFGLTLIGILAS